jgi:hypothetical protein
MREERIMADAHPRRDLITQHKSHQQDTMRILI